MVAVVMYIEKKTITPPPELVIGWDMQWFGGMPNPGGVLDQPYNLMARIRTALNTETNWKRWKVTPVTEHIKLMTSEPGFIKSMTWLQKAVYDGE